MDQNEEAVQSSGSKTLLVRHLPAALSQDEKEDLLKYFGAQTVRVFPTRGRMVSSDGPSSYSGCLSGPCFHASLPLSARRNTPPLQRLEARNLPRT